MPRRILRNIAPAAAEPPPQPKKRTKKVTETRTGEKDVMAWYSQLHPLNAVGMPIPGEDFIRAARELGDTTTEVVGKGPKQQLITVGSELADVIYQSLYGHGNYQLRITVKGNKTKLLDIIPGHLWGAAPDGEIPGPERADVMIIGKMQGEEEVQRRRCFIGGSGQLFLDTIRKLDIPGASRWYLTNLLKCEHPEGTGNSTLKQSWVRGMLHLLHQELRIVKPKYILCLGADSIKALLGKNWNLDKMEGRVVDFEFPLHLRESDPPVYHHCQVMASTHPAAVFHAPEKSRPFERAVTRFGKLVQGVRWDKHEEGLDHRVIDNEPDLLALAEEVDAYYKRQKRPFIAVDCEWEGQHPENAGSYLRTIQFSWRYKSAALVVMRAKGGAPGFKRVDPATGELTTDGGEKRAIEILKWLLKRKRIAGAFLAADLEWLTPAGLDLRDEFAAPDRWQKCLTEGGLDVANMSHAVEETGDHSLNGIAQAYTDAPRYDVELQKWKEKRCKELKIKPKDLEGYGECDDAILYPYALYDADVTWRACFKLFKLLSCDRFGNNCWEAFWISQRAALAVLEIKTSGLLLDKRRVDDLTATYMQVKNEIEERIRTWARWPKLNLNSNFQVRELLFGTKYNGKELVDGVRPRLRPHDARSLLAKPLLTTDKRQRAWSDVMEEGKEEECTASTNKTTLGIMLHEAANLEVRRNGRWVKRDCKTLITDVRNYRFISQVLKSVLRPPDTEDTDEQEGGYAEDEDGNWVYSAGLPGFVCDDGKIRTTIYQTKETGRWSSARPPLQNISKRREPDYEKILAERYTYPLRSVIMAAPGTVLVEADYVGAELFGAAIMADDRTMIEHALRNQLPESDPKFYDMHSNVAVRAFRFDCPPTKGGLKSIGKSHMRIVAKSVVFGLMYGRGAKAIALAAREEGVQITTEEAQQVIEAVFDLYPGLVTFFEECRRRAVTQYGSKELAPMWLCGAFGRYRRFNPTKDRQVAGDMEREAMNFPIQGMIADAVSHAIANIYEYRQNARAAGWTPEDLDYRIVLQIHDAIILQVPVQHVPMVVDEVLPTCMSKLVPIYPCSLDGMPTGAGPFHLGIDVDIADHWGVKMMPDECQRLGISPKYAHWHWDADRGGYLHPELSKQIWKGGRLIDLAA